MRYIKNSLWRGRLAVLILPALLAGGLSMSGCGNDPIGPQDGPPALSQDDAASQAGFVAMAASIVAPQAIEFAGKADKDSYQHSFFGNVSGTVYLDFFSGGPSGTSVPWDQSDYVDLATADGESIVISVGIGGTIALTFDLAADLDRVSTPNTATVGGTGTYVSGVFDSDFSFNGMVVESGGNYPGSGTMDFTSAKYTMTVTYDGDNTARMDMSGGPTYIIDLDTGDVTALTGDG